MITPRILEPHEVWMEAEDLTILGAVDSDVTRLYLESIIEKRGEGTIISGGNRTTTGESIVSAWRNGQNVTSRLTDQSLGLAASALVSHFPDEPDCHEVTESEPQTCLANNLVAAIMLAQLFQLVTQEEGALNKGTHARFDMNYGAAVIATDQHVKPVHQGTLTLTQEVSHAS